MHFVEEEDNGEEQTQTQTKSKSASREPGLILVNYDQASHVYGSDHRPVFAQFTAQI